MFPGKPQWDVGRCGWWWWCGWWGEAVVRRSWNSVCVKITISHATFHTCIKPNVEEAHLRIYSEALSDTHTHTHTHTHTDKQSYTHKQGLPWAADAQSWKIICNRKKLVEAFWADCLEGPH